MCEEFGDQTLVSFALLDIIYGKNRDWDQNTETSAKIFSRNILHPSLYFDYELK